MESWGRSSRAPGTRRALVPRQRRAETGRQRFGQGHRQLLHADDQGDSELAIAHTSSGAEALAKKVRRGRAWCTAETTKAKQVAARLIRDVGFDPIDAGPLRTARYMEPFTMLVAQLAYEGTSGPQVAYRFERFASRVTAYR